MKLTKTQTAIMEHRLSIGDCIAETLTTDLDDPKQYTYDDVEKVAERLWKMLPDLPDKPSSIECDVLEDVLDGCTYFGSMDLYESEQKCISHIQVACQLEDIISELIGKNVQCAM